MPNPPASDIWDSLDVPSEERPSVEQFLNKILDSKSNYRERRIGAREKKEIEDAIKADITGDSMPGCVKTKYAEDGPGTVTSLYQLALILKAKKGTAPAPARSQSTEDAQHSSKPAVMPTPTQPPILTHFQDRSVLIHYINNRGESAKNVFVLSQFTGNRAEVKSKRIYG
jgi:hypothetical protein